MSASSPAYQAARLRFTPTDDAYVQEGMPYANYNDDYVVVDQDARYDGLLRFYVQGLEDRNVEYVKLRLYVSNQSTMGGKFFKCREDWHEDVVTWDSVPSIIDDKPIAIIKAALLDEWVEIDVSGLVQEDGRKFDLLFHPWKFDLPLRLDDLFVLRLIWLMVQCRQANHDAFAD